MKAAHNGFAPSQLAAGLMLYYGKGVPKNEKEGLKWIKRAAKQGLIEAIEELKKIQGH